MFDVIGDINWLGVTLGTLAYYILGALWFTPLFGKKYDEALGVKRDKNQKWGLIYYLLPFISALAVSIATGVIVAALSLTKFSDAIALGAIVGFGYTLPVSFNNALNPITPKPVMYGVVTGGYHVIGAIVVSAIIASV